LSYHSVGLFDLSDLAPAMVWGAAALALVVGVVANPFQVQAAQSYGSLTLGDLSLALDTAVPDLLGLDRGAESAHHSEKSWQQHVGQAMDRAEAEESLHFGCAHVADAFAAARALANLGGQPVFNSVEHDRTCFTFVANAATGAALVSGPDSVLFIAAPMPRLAKVSPELFRRLVSEQGDQPVSLDRDWRRRMPRRELQAASKEERQSSSSPNGRRQHEGLQDQELELSHRHLHAHPNPGFRVGFQGAQAPPDPEAWLQRIKSLTDETQSTGAGSSGLPLLPRKRGAAATQSLSHCQFELLTWRVTRGSSPRGDRHWASAEISGLKQVASQPAERDSCWMVLAEFLADHPLVSSVTPVPLMQSHNYISTQIMQTGSPTGTERPLWALGVNGSGEVAGVADSGIDLYSCYFLGPSDPVQMTDRNNWLNGALVTDLTQRKVVQYVAYADSYDDVGGHGTHVCGTVSGAQNSNWETVNNGTSPVYFGDNETIDYSGYVPFDEVPDNKGVAPQAKIAFFDIGITGWRWLAIPDDYQAMFDSAYEAGARVHSNSWGAAVNTYRPDDLQVDMYIYDHPDFAILFAAGNEGDLGYHSVGSPGLSKNAITVGASEGGPARHTNNFKNLASFSSMGPTYDERIKPDVVAPGFYVISAHSQGPPGYPAKESCAEQIMAGTSMATPGVAGTALLLRHYFRLGKFLPYAEAMSGEAAAATSIPVDPETGCLPAYSTSCNLTLPSAALIKAMLVHSGDDLEKRGVGDTYIDIKDPTPNNIEGFGRVNLMNVIPEIGSDTSNALYIDDTIQRNNSGLQNNCPKRSYNATVNGDSGVGLRASLTWTDPPSGSIYSKSQLMNNLDLRVVDPDGAEVWGNGKQDNLNNVERVTIDLPMSGNYIIEITAAPMVTAAQDYSLIVSGDLFVTEVQEDCSFIYTSGGSGSSDDDDDDGFTLGIVLGVIIPFFFLAVGTGAFYYWRSHRKKTVTLASQSSQSTFTVDGLQQARVIGVVASG